ncbi:MAG: hypothetical protein NVS2B12_04220 [Ktedonobacteraceae bacterium]
MKQTLKFSQALKAIINRASTRYQQRTSKVLPLNKIAHDVGIPLTILARALRGEHILDNSYLLPLFVYLGCNEVEQRFLYHLAELTLPDASEDESITDEQAATLFALQYDTDPMLERITEKHSTS